MAILTREIILEEIEDGSIKIEPFLPDQVGPASVDLHLGNMFRILKAQEKIFPVTEDAHAETISEIVGVPEGGFFALRPGQTVLGITLEKITLSPDLCGWVEGRSRFARIGLGVHITSGFVQPGIANHQVLEITNLSPSTLGLYPGTRICQFIFERCEGEARYTGEFQGQNQP